MIFFKQNFESLMYVCSCFPPSSISTTSQRRHGRIGGEEWFLTERKQIGPGGATTSVKPVEKNTNYSNLLFIHDLRFSGVFIGFGGVIWIIQVLKMEKMRTEGLRVKLTQWEMVMIWFIQCRKEYAKVEKNGSQI